MNIVKLFLVALHVGLVGAPHRGGYSSPCVNQQILGELARYSQAISLALGGARTQLLSSVQCVVLSSSDLVSPRFAGSMAACCNDAEVSNGVGGASATASQHSTNTGQTEASKMGKEAQQGVQETASEPPAERPLDNGEHHSDTPSQKAGPVAIVLTNGDKDRERTPVNSEAASHKRATSSASVHSEGLGSYYLSSSSSSFSTELSQNSSFNSRELLEQLVVDLHSSSVSGEALEKNAAVKQLLEHIVTLKLELEEMRQENERLKQIRVTMDDELHTLTENLFEEAYKMVDTAKEEKGLAVKKLADAAGKIDAMETEMSALKNVLHATPSSLKTGKDSPSSLSASPHNKHRKPNMKKAFRKLSRKIKVPSKSSVGSLSSQVPHALVEHKNQVKGACLVEGQMSPDEFSVFKDWLTDVCCSDHPYLLSVMDQDVLPCLNFSNKELSAQVLTAVKNNHLSVESLPACTAGEKRQCVLSGSEEICCTHRMQLTASQPWQYISQHCRDRIAAVCDFYMCMNHIQKGILKSEPTQLYWQLNRLRAQMNLARLTLLLPE